MNFASKSANHENSLRSFTCRKAGTWDILFYFPSEGRHTEDLPDARKIQRLRPGLNSRTRVPVASMLTTRPPKPSSYTLCGSTVHTGNLNKIQPRRIRKFSKNCSVEKADPLSLSTNHTSQKCVEKVKLDKQIGGWTEDTKFSSERRHTMELVNGQEQGLNPMANLGIICKIFLYVGFSVCIYSPQNSEKTQTW